MTLPPWVYRGVVWFNLPAGMLMALLQRTPVLRVMAWGEQWVVSSPMSVVLKSTVAVAASLGAMHSLVGATQLVFSPAESPGTATVGTSKTILFTVTGAQAAPGSFTVSGNPPGMLFYPYPVGSAAGVSSGLIKSSTIQLAGTPTVTGPYTLSLKAWQNSDGSGDNATYSYSVVISGGTSVTPAPTITAQPQSVTVSTGSTISLTVAGTNISTYQWRKDGVAVTGATADSLILQGITAAAAGSYTAVLSNNGGSVTTTAAVVSIGSGQSRISNLSVRTNLGSGQILTVGFVTNGSKGLLLRAVGPTLNSLFGITNFYADPKVSVFNQSGVSIANNDNWDSSLTPIFDSLGAFRLDANSKDSAISLSSVNGPVTAQINGTGSGVMLVEVYDRDGSNSVRLTNVSARNQVGTGADILISGFVVVGPVAKTLLIRGIGPALKDVFNVSGGLVDPKLEIYTQANVKVAENDNWTSTLVTTFDQVGAYRFNAGSKDSALLITLPPGVYTAQVSGVSSGTGDGVVEVYEVP